MQVCYLLMDLWETFLIAAEDKLEGGCPRSGEPDSYRKKNMSVEVLRNALLKKFSFIPTILDTQ